MAHVHLRLIRFSVILFIISVVFIFVSFIARSWILVNITVSTFGQRSDSRGLAKMELAAGLWDSYHGDSHDTSTSKSVPPLKMAARILSVVCLGICAPTLFIFIYITITAAKCSQTVTGLRRALHVIVIISLSLTCTLTTIIFFLRLAELVPVPKHSNSASKAPQTGPLDLRDLETRDGLLSKSGEKHKNARNQKFDFKYHYEYSWAYGFYLCASAVAGFLLTWFNFARFLCSISHQDDLTDDELSQQQRHDDLYSCDDVNGNGYYEYA